MFYKKACTKFKCVFQRKHRIGKSLFPFCSKTCSNFFKSSLASEYGALSNAQSYQAKKPCNFAQSLAFSCTFRQEFVIKPSAANVCIIYPHSSYICLLWRNTAESPLFVHSKFCINEDRLWHSNWRLWSVPSELYWTYRGRLPQVVRYYGAFPSTKWWYCRRPW